MNNNIIEHSKNINHYNLNFIMDNFKITIHNYTIETFDYVDGYDLHNHSSYELHYIRGGTGLIHFNNTDYELRRGDLCLLSPNTQHKQVVFNHNMIEYALRFDIKQLQSTSKNQTSISESEHILKLIENSSNQMFHNQLDFESLFENSYSEAYNQKPGYYIVIKQYLMSIIIKAARLALSEGYSEPAYCLPVKSTERTQMQIISKFIRDNIASNITNCDLSKHVNISERQLHRVVKKKTGLAPHQYVLQIRINYVIQLLTLNTYTLKTISEMAGFSSEFHLSSAFKKYSGMTPTEYINSSIDLYEIAIDPKHKTIRLY